MEEGRTTAPSGIPVPGTVPGQPSIVLNIAPVFHVAAALLNSHRSEVFIKEQERLAMQEGGGRRSLKVPAMSRHPVEV